VSAGSDRAAIRNLRSNRAPVAAPAKRRYPYVFSNTHTNMKRAQDFNQLIDLVHEAVYEVDELRACLEHDDDEASTYTPFLDDLDKMLRDLHEAMASGKYAGVGSGEDLPFMPLFKKHERSIPFRELLRTINATHREGYEP
jgi:hypothetical protein